MKLQLMTSDARAVTSVPTLVGRETVPWGTYLAPIEARDLGSLYIVAIVEAGTMKDGSAKTSAVMAREAALAAQRWADAKRPRQRWIFRALNAERDPDGNPLPVATRETATFALYASLLRDASPTGDVREGPTPDAIANAERARERRLAAAEVRNAKLKVKAAAQSGNRDKIAAAQAALKAAQAHAAAVKAGQ